MVVLVRTWIDPFSRTSIKSAQVIFSSMMFPCFQPDYPVRH